MQVTASYHTTFTILIEREGGIVSFQKELLIEKTFIRLKCFCWISISGWNSHFLLILFFKGDQGTVEICT